MQFMSLKTFQVLGSRATSLDRRRRRHGSGAPALQRGGDRHLRGYRATAAVSPLLKEVNGCGGHSVVRGLGLKPLRIKRLARLHGASRPVIPAAPVPRRKERRFGSSKEIHTGDDKENRNGKRGRKAPPEAKSPLRLVSVECNPAPDAEHRLRGPWFPIVVDRFLRERDVCEMVAVHRSTLGRWVEEGLFPAPIRIGPVAVRWRLSAVQEWMASK
jgi:prophage regulatory protein